VICVLLASAITIYIGPGANGSGIAEFMGVMNGINYPDFLTFRSLFAKITGTILAVSGGLAIGKEGPLLHIGAILGVIVIYLPIDKFKFMQNDKIKREFIAAGGASGIAAAFGAPIGGALFTYEMSTPNTFWTF
jgi:H+/Cl- antiporter ClcA